MYYRIQESINSIYGVIDNPENVSSEVSFLTGKFINDRLPSQFIFTIDHPKNKAPGHLLGWVIPIASKAFIESLQAAGIDNFQLFPAVLRQTSTGVEYSNYFAFNIIGLLDAVDTVSSTYDVIMPGDDGMPELADFDELVFSKEKTQDVKLFRLLQNPVDIYIKDSAMEILRSRKPEGGWGLTSYEISTV